MKDGFFIGWKGHVPTRSGKSIRKLLLLTLLVVALLAACAVIFQKTFTNYNFVFGKVEDFQGILITHPIPLLKVSEASDKTLIGHYALLVGYGKSGAEGIIQLAESTQGSMDRKNLTISGTLISGDGKYLIELTQKEHGISNIINGSNVDDHLENAGTKSLRGEIVDPKCYFGVMKPGEGKIHKSCAIRCISGGIPPVLKVSKNGNFEYYILLGETSDRINKQVLPFIAEDVEVSGSVYSQYGWNFVRTGEDKIKLVE